MPKPARLVHDLDVVGADLVSEPARSGVDEHGELTGTQTEHARDAGVEDFVDPLHLEEVVPAAERSELVAPALLRARRHARGIGTRQAPPRFEVLEVGRDAETAIANEVWDAVAEDPLELRVGAHDATVVSIAGGDAASELVHELRHPRRHVGSGEIRREEAHAAVDVETDPAGEITPSGSMVAATPPTGKP